MNWVFSAEELNALCLMYSGSALGPLPLGKLYKLFPNGVKNKLKWKNKIGINKILKEVKEMSDKEGLEENEDFLKAMDVLLFSDNAIYTEKSGVRLYNFYEKKFDSSEESFISLRFLENVRYELYLYESKFAWLDKLEEIL